MSVPFRDFSRSFFELRREGRLCGGASRTSSSAENFVFGLALFAREPKTVAGAGHWATGVAGRANKDGGEKSDELEYCSTGGQQPPRIPQGVEA